MSWKYVQKDLLKWERSHTVINQKRLDLKAVNEGSNINRNLFEEEGKSEVKWGKRNVKWREEREFQ